MDFSADRSGVDALSWRLASELVRRHPHDLWLNRGHPGGGLYDCLMIGATGGPAQVFLNRVGTIQVHGRFDGRPSGWPPATWGQYLTADPKQFLLALEDAAGLAAPPSVPGSTNPVLLYRIFAVLSALTSKSPAPFTFEQGYIDSSDWDGPNDSIEAFPAAARDLAAVRQSSPRGEPGFQYWMAFRGGRPLGAFERESSRFWGVDDEQPRSLARLYGESGRNVEVAALRLLSLLSR